MSFRPTVCAAPGCGKPLPISRGSGRPRRYCDDRCRYAARHARDRHRGRELERAPIVPEAEPDRDELAASLALLVAPRSRPAAPEDQLGRALVELRAVTSRLRVIEPDLPDRLSAPAGKLARGIEREVRRAFPELENV